MFEKLQKDAGEIYEKFKKEKDEKKKVEYAYDYLGIKDMIYHFVSHDKLLEVPYEIKVAFDKKQKEIQETKRNITEQVYANLDQLEKIYESFMGSFLKIDFSRVDSRNELGTFDMNILNDFFQEYQLGEEFQKVMHGERVFMVDDENIASSVTLKSIGKNYLFLSKNDNFSGMKTLTHEMGHLYANNLENNTQVTTFVDEFMSILMEHLFLIYSEKDNYAEAHCQAIKDCMTYYMVIRQAYCQVILMKNNPDVFYDMQLNPYYRSTLYRMLSGIPYDDKRETLKLHYYALGFLLTATFYEKLKDGRMSLEDIEKFYLINYHSNDLTSLIKNISLTDVEDYVINVFNPNTKMKVKK